MEIRADGVIDRGSAHQFTSTVARTSVGIDNHGARPWEILQQSRTHTLHDLSNRSSVIVRGHSNQNVHFANINQLANELVGKYCFLGQKQLLASSSWLLAPARLGCCLLEASG